MIQIEMVPHDDSRVLMKDSRSKTNEQKGQHDTEKQGPEDHTGDV
jgi:hypothetical protein